MEESISPMAGRSWARTESNRRSAWVRFPFQVMMVGIQEFYHLVHIGAVLGGLEGVGPEELIVVHKVKGEGGQALSLLFQFLCADGRHQAGIHAPERKVQMGTSETICLRTESSTRNDVFSMVRS